jgi:hypothetical protein
MQPTFMGAVMSLRFASALAATVATAMTFGFLATAAFAQAHVLLASVPAVHAI